MDFKEHLYQHYPHIIVDELLLSLEKESVHAALLNPKKMSDETFLSLFPHVKKHPFIPHAFYYDKNEYLLGKNIFHDAGAYYLQDPSAMLVAAFLPISKGDYILDMCAAPGGKTIQTAFHEGVTVVANDISYPRALTLSSNIERMGLGNVMVTAMNLHQFPSSYHHFFDSIILDAPCSGSGMFRKQEEMRLDWTYNKVLECAKTQKELLSLADSFLKPGGHLLYSTCSFSYEEDEAPILDFLNEHEDYELISLPSSPSFYEHPSLKGSIHLFPSLYQGEGQFIALLHKKGNKEVTLMKKGKKDKQNFPFLKDFSLPSLDYLLKNDTLYGLSSYLPTEKMTVIRYGLEIGEIKKDRFLPSHALSHFLSWDRNIILNEEEVKKYIHGDTLSCDTSLSGYYIATYQGVALGFLKATQGTLKNFYPKGLRR